MSVELVLALILLLVGGVAIVALAITSELLFYVSKVVRKTSNPLADYIKAHPFVGPFKPGPRLHPTMNGLECWVKDAPAVSEDVSPHLTIHRCMTTGEVVGVTVWGVSQAIFQRASR